MHLKRVCLVVFLLVGAFVLPPFSQRVQANGAPMYYSGFALKPGDPNTQITLTAEKVEARVADQTDQGVPMAFVRATFWLRNTGEATTQIVGFPADDPESRFLYGAAFDSFSVSVEGQQVASQDAQIPTDTALPGEGRLWRIWEMTFGPGETRIVEVEYSQQMIHGIYAGSLAAPEALAFDYVLVTGRGWKGPIGRADISVTLPQSVASREQVFVVVPEGAVMEGQTVRWTLTDFEPYGNVMVAFRTPRGQSRIAAAQKAVANNPASSEAHWALAKEYASSWPIGAWSYQGEVAQVTAPVVTEAEAAFRLSSNVEIVDWLAEVHAEWTARMRLGGSVPNSDAILKQATTYAEKALAMAPTPQREYRLRQFLADGATVSLSRLRASGDERSLRQLLATVDRALGLACVGCEHGSESDLRCGDDALLAIKKGVYVELVRLSVEAGDLGQGVKWARELSKITIDERPGTVDLASGMEETLVSLGRALAAPRDAVAAREVFEIALQEWYPELPFEYRIVKREQVRIQAEASLGALWPTPTASPAQPTNTEQPQPSPYPAPVYPYPPPVLSPSVVPHPWPSLVTLMPTPVPPNYEVSLSAASGGETGSSPVFPLWQLTGAVLLSAVTGFALGRWRKPPNSGA